MREVLASFPGFVGALPALTCTYRQKPAKPSPSYCPYPLMMCPVTGCGTPRIHDQTVVTSAAYLGFRFPPAPGSDSDVEIRVSFVLLSYLSGDHKPQRLHPDSFDKLLR